MKSHTKRLIVINLLLLFALTALNSQVVYFSGKDKTSGTTVQLDSIKIINNTLQRDTTIYVDSIDLSVLTGIDESQNFDNSDFTVENKSDLVNGALSFRVKANGDIYLTINIYNLVGTSILSQRKNLSQGNHYIKLNEILIPGIYFASFSDGRTTQTIKILKTDELFGNFSSINQNPQEKKIVLVNDEYTFIGYAKGFRRDSINDIGEDGKLYEFQLVKLGDWEFNDWRIYLSSMSFLAIYKEYWPIGNPPNMGTDSNIYNGSIVSKEINYKKNDFQNFGCHNSDKDILIYNNYYCNSTNSFRSKEFWDNYITLNFYFNIDSINNTIKSLKLFYEYNGEDYLHQDYTEELRDEFYIILENVPYTLNSDGSIIAEVKKMDYQINLNEYKNDYKYLRIEGMSGIRWWKRYIEWYRLNKINNDTFFRLVLSK